MGIRIGTSKYRRRTNMSRGPYGGGFIILGIFVILMATMFVTLIIREQKKIPDDAVWYGATVSKIISSDIQEKWETDDDGYEEKVIYYISNAELQYEVNGITYTTSYLYKDEKGPLAVGDPYYVSIIPNNPEVVYKVTDTVSDNTPKIILGIFYVIGIGCLGLGIYMEVARRKKSNRINTFETYQNTSYNNGGNQYAPTHNDYSGTSLRD